MSPTTPLPASRRPRRGALAALALLLVVVPARPPLAQPADSAAVVVEESERVTQARRALADAEAENGAQSLEAARACDELVKALRAEFRFAEPETWELARRALAAKEELLGPDDPELVESLLSLAGQNRDAREYDTARELAERALGIQERAFGTEDARLAGTLTLLMALHKSQGDYDGASAMGERALAVHERTGNAETTAAARTLAELAGLYRLRGDYNAALDAGRRALEIRERELGPDHVDVARSLHTLATLRFFTGDRKGAREAARRATDLLEKIYGPDHLTVALAIDVLAMATDDPDEATAYWDRAIAILEKQLGPDHPQLSHPHNNLGLHLLRLGRAEEAAPHLETALRLQRAVLGEDSPDLAKYQGNVAKGMLAAGDAARAIPLLESTIDILERTEGSESPSLAIALDDLARCRRRTGDPAGAFAEALEAESIARRHFLTNARGMPEHDALDYAKSRPRGLDVALTLVAENGAPDAPPEPAWDAAVRSRAMVLDEVAERRSAVGRLDSLRTRWERATDEYAALAVRGTDATGIERARDAWRESERDLARAISDGAGDPAGGPGLDEVRAALPPGSCLVAFVLYRAAGPAEEGAPVEEIGRYLAFVLGPDDASARAVALGSSAGIDSLVTAVRERSGRGVPEEDYRAAAGALRERIWDPLGITGADCVFVVPDGSLALVNLAALPRAGGGYLAEEPFAIHHLSAERDLLPEPPSPGSGLLALGGADYDADVLLAASAPSGPAGRPMFRGGHSGCADLASAHFEALPGTKVEVERIGGLWRETRKEDVVLLTGAAAREDRLKQDAPGQRIVHLAAHGFFLAPDCQDAGPDTRGVVGTAPLGDDASAALSRDNPLITSGIALAGANGRAATRPGQEDGILTAEEIAALDLSGVEWAVLSGCDTGRGSVLRGEGVTGLRRAFRVAGARTLIMSLWPVSDEETVDWMTELYRARFAEGLSTADAVRAASLRRLLDARARGESTHPFAWGAFVAAGDWR